MVPLVVPWDGTEAKFAYKVGIGLEVPFANTNVWSFQTGLNFISKGVKGNGVTDAWDVVDVTINQLYLELPLMVGARIHTASNFDLLFKGGPYLAYGVGGKTKIDGVSEKADTFGDDGLKRFDAGLGLGVAFEFGKIVVGVETGTSFTKGEFYQFNLSSCIRQQNSLTAQFVSFSLANLANIFYPPRFLQ